MQQKTVMAPYGVYVNVYEVIHEGITYWFTEKAMREARRCTRTHEEGADAKSEPLEDWTFRGDSK